MTDFAVFTENISFPYGPITEGLAERILDRLYGLLEIGGRGVTVVLCDDSYIAGINSRFRGKEGPTDVISFAECDSDGDIPWVTEDSGELGEIYISLERALGQAPVFGTTPEGEVARLIVHGLLHLLGYDHEKTEEEARRMEEKEDELARALALC